MAAPTFVGLNELALSASGSGSVVWTVGHQADDIGVIVVQTANQTVSTPTGFTLLGNIGTGSAGAAGAVAVWVFWKRATSAAEGDVTIADAGDHVRARMLLFRGCETSGSPLDGAAVTDTVAAASATTAVSIAMPTTTVADTFCVGLVANATDATNNQTTVGSWVNAALAGFTRVLNGNTNVGVGGGCDGGGGTKAAAGAVGNSTSTLGTASAQALLSFALKPPGSPPVGDVTNGGIYVATGVKATAGATGATTATLDTAAVQARLTFALLPPDAPPVDLPPVVEAIPAIVGAVDAPAVFPIVASDPEGATLTLTLVAGDTAVPSGAEILEDEQSGLYSFDWTPTSDQAGEWIFAVEVSDGTTTVSRPIHILIQALPDDTLLTLAQALVARAETDLESARALLDLVIANTQINAEVAAKTEDLVADLEASRDYFEGIAEDLETPEE